MPSREIDTSRLEAAAAAEIAEDEKKRQEALAATPAPAMFYEISPQRRAEAARDLAMFTDKRARLVTAKFGQNVPKGAVDSRMAASALAITMAWWVHTLPRSELEAHLIAFNQAVRLHYMQWRKENGLDQEEEQKS